jgi:hypothetical protein
MEKQNNHQYGQTDPDFIDQNTLVDGNNILNEDQLHQTVQKEDISEFGESDPDYIDQNTLVDNDNYARDEDPYQYKEEFIEDLKNPENKAGNVVNKNDAITNDESKNDLNKDNE